jgi:hypothetical protein
VPSALVHDSATALAGPFFDRTIGVVIPFFLPRTIVSIANSLEKLTPV